MAVYSKYKVNLPGPYHIKKGIPCQDAYCIRESADGAIIAAVADGLGSEAHSDIGAKIASNFVVGYCIQHYKIGLTDGEIVALLKRAYSKAYTQVEKKAIKDGNEPDQYDCTLCTAIYDGKNLYYGQAGDSGLIVGSNDGRYYKITEQQRDEDGNVYPLCFGEEYWEFGRVNGNVVSVMLMTDGVWEQACPPILRLEQQQINVGFVEMFMNHYGMSDQEVRKLEREACSYMRKFPKERLDDDKTIVVIINSEAKPVRREDSYYAIPNWDLLAEEREKRLWNQDALNVDIESENVTDAEQNENVLRIPVDLSAAGKAIQTLVDKVDDLLVPGTKVWVEDTKKKDAQDNTYRYKGIEKKGSVLGDMIALILFVIVSLMAWKLTGVMKKWMPLTLLGLLLTCFVMNSTVLLPSSSLLVVLEYSYVLNPLSVIIVGAIGASLGELTGYMVGVEGGTIVRKITRRANFRTHSFWLVALFAVVPFPIFDIAGIVAGSIRMNPLKFLMAGFIGKAVKMGIYVAAFHFICSIRV